MWRGVWRGSPRRKQSGRAEGDGTKVTKRERERERESPKRTFSQKTTNFCRFAPSPGNSSVWRAQETAENRSFFSQRTEDFRRKLQETADWAPSP